MQDKQQKVILKELANLCKKKDKIVYGNSLTETSANAFAALPSTEDWQFTRDTLSACTTHTSNNGFPVSLDDLQQKMNLIKKKLKHNITIQLPSLKLIFKENLMKGELSEADFITKVLPNIITHALELDILFPNGIPLLLQNVNKVIQMTKRQVACLLSNMFLCTFPVAMSYKMQRFNECTLLPLFLTCRAPQETAKLCMFLAYFQQIAETDDNILDTRLLWFRRQVLADITTDTSTTSTVPDYLNCNRELCDVVMKPKNVDLDVAVGCLQADFANQFIGGGVIVGGCVQEEIRFARCPELAASCIFCSEMAYNEAIVITGARHYSKAAGYMFNLRYGGKEDVSENDNIATIPTSLDDNAPTAQFSKSSIVAIDAAVSPSRSPALQLSSEFFVRDLFKATAGFANPALFLANCHVHIAGGSVQKDVLLSPQHCECNALTFTNAATGNWGCGAFGGHLEIKALVQWLAVSVADNSNAVSRVMEYYPWTEDAFGQRFINFVQFVKSKVLFKCCAMIPKKEGVLSLLQRHFEAKYK